MFIFWLFVIFLLIAAWLAVWSFVSSLVGSRVYQAEFTAGRLPEERPDGFYRGRLYVPLGEYLPWLGKTFNLAENSGINVIPRRGPWLLKILTPFYNGFRSNSDGTVSAYRFTTRVAPGVRDEQLSVIKLDYDLPENPFLVRLLLDEIVETAPDEFLGKIHLKVFPGFFAAVGYFRLAKA